MVMECSQVNHAVNCGNMLLKSPSLKKTPSGEMKNEVNTTAKLCQNSNKIPF